MVFYHLVFLGFLFLFVCLAFLANKLTNELPASQRLINVEKMLIKHIEDAKGTIATMEEIKKSNQTIIDILQSH